MGKVKAGISMPLDGFVPDPNVTGRLGEGGDVLHRWFTEPEPVEGALLARRGAGAGAILMGQHPCDLAEGVPATGDATQLRVRIVR